MRSSLSRTSSGRILMLSRLHFVVSDNDLLGSHRRQYCSDAILNQRTHGSTARPHTRTPATAQKHTHMRAHACTHACIHACTYESMHRNDVRGVQLLMQGGIPPDSARHLSIHMSLHMSLHMFTHMFTTNPFLMRGHCYHMRACVRVCVCVCVCACVRECVSA